MELVSKWLSFIFIFTLNIPTAQNILKILNHLDYLSTKTDKRGSTNDLISHTLGKVFEHLE